MVLLACGPVPATPGDTGAESTTALASTSTAAITTGPADTSGGHGSTADPTTSTSEESTDASSSGIPGDPKDMGVDVQCNPFTQDCPPGMKCAPYAEGGGSSWNSDKCVPVSENPAQVHEPCVTEGGGLSGFDNCDVESCSTFAQDCPEGMKCMPYAEGGGSSWNNFKCVPVVEDPKQLGESCFAAEGGVGGVDDCDLGLMCWEVDAQNHGICFELCGGNVDAPICKVPKHACSAYAEGTLPLCFPWCDPLAPDCVSAGIEGFFCVSDASGDEGQLHDPCAFPNACDAGLQCVESASAVECDSMQESCCEPFCDLSLPEACPGVGQVCNAYFEDGTAPMGCENVGVCGMPM